MEVDEGSCDDGRNDLLKRWHFNSKTGSCVPFIYVGCAGNRSVHFHTFLPFFKDFSFFCSNRFKSYDLCMGFCDAAIRDQLSNNPDVIPDKSPMSFVTEPPLGPRPDLIEDYGDGDQNEVEEDEIEPIIEEYDEAKCEVSIGLQY